MNLTQAILLAGLSPCVALAGVESIPVSSKDVVVAPAAAASRWSFGISFAPLLNVDAEFSGAGTFDSPFTPQPLGGGRDYEYDDGFVRVDASGNAQGLTSNWGYANTSQYNPSGSGSISNSITNSLRTGRTGETEDFSPGFELFGYLDLGKIAEISGRPVNWGIKGTLHYANISIDNSRALTSDILRVTDSFDLGGVLPPGAGYEGSPTGPGPLLGDSPTRSTTIIADGASISGRRELDVDMVTFGAGPYLKVPLGDKLSLFAEAGVTLGIARGEYDFDSTTTIAGVGTRSASGSKDQTRLLPGAYAGLSAIWKLTDHFGIQGSARYQYIDAFETGAGGSDATLSFDGACVLSIGGVWTF